MTDTPLFERIPAPPKTYDQLVELNHYYRHRLTIAENRLAELTALICEGDEDGIEAPLNAWEKALEQIHEWERHDQEHPE